MADRLGERRNAIAKEDEYDPFPGTSEEGPHFRIRDVFTSHHSESGYDHGVPVDVTHYIQDKSLRHRFVLLSLSNSKLGIRLLLLRAVFLLLACALYVVETAYFDYFSPNGTSVFLDASTITNNTLETITLEAQALVLLRAEKPYWLWSLQVLVSLVILANGIMVIYATSSNTCQGMLRSLSPNILITVTIPLLFVFTLLYPPVLKNLFVPSFLYCWPALQSFTAAVLQAVQRNAQLRPSTFRLRVITLTTVFICFLFTWTCVFHHAFRIDSQYTLFEAYYFLMVTMSTVGYGDISPKHWTGQLLVTVFVFTAILNLIPQLHQLYEAFTLQQKLQNTVGFKDLSRRHILICSTSLKPLVLRDFLTEFYSDPAHYDVHCVVLVEEELSIISQTYLRHPIWAKRITVLIGTPLRVWDLHRARAHGALACFIHTPRDKVNTTESDQHTIMCAWAIKDFAPGVELYVQILNPGNRLHLAVADHVVCEGELKSALLASNSICPGISTLVTLLMHTFKPEQRPLSSEEYQLYTKCAPCEVYDNRLGDSKYFHHFQGKNFLYTAVVAFRKYHVTLLGVHSFQTGQLLLNPGLDYIMHENDICYYIGVTQEKYSKVGGATSISHALQGTCAKLAIYTMASVGIDPYRLNERAAGGRRDSIESGPSRDISEGPQQDVSFFISMSESDPSLNNEHQLAAVETRRGLHLFKFMGDIDHAANPVVKVCLTGNSLQHSGENSSVGSHDYHGPTHDPPAITVESHDYGRRVSEPHLLQPPHHHLHYRRQTSEPHVLYRRSHENLYRAHEHRHESHDRFRLRPPLPAIRERTISESSHQSLKRSLSDNSVVGDRVLYSSKLELMNSTSRLNKADDHHPHSRWHLPRPSLWSAHSSARNSMTSLDTGDEVVELELANIQEEEELEELEDGLCEEASSEGRSPSPDQELLNEDRPRYWKGQVPSAPYFGFESQNCHLLHEQRCHDDVMLNSVNGDMEAGLSIVYSPHVTDDLYHFIFPTRAASLPSSSLKPLVLLVKSKPTAEFLGVIAWLPLVYCLTGDITDVNHWLRAGIALASTVVILRDPVTPELTAEQQEHFADSAHIMAVHKLTTLFPHVSIVTELHYRYNIRFMRFTDCDNHFMGNFNALMRKGDHLTYLFVPQFAGGRVFCPSMLDTLLYQNFVKPYMTDLIRQLLGCKHEEDSGYLWHIPVTHDLLMLETYDRVFQRLASQHRYIPLGIHRTIPESQCVDLLDCSQYTQRSGEGPAIKEFMKAERVASFLSTRMETLGLAGLSKVGGNRDRHQSFVLPNPPPKTRVRDSDIILVIHPAHHSHPHAHPATPPASTSYSARTASQSTPTHSLPSHATPPRSTASRSTASQSTPARSTATPPSHSRHGDAIQVSVPIECHDYDSVFIDENESTV